MTIFERFFPKNSGSGGLIRRTANQQEFDRPGTFQARGQTAFKGMISVSVQIVSAEYPG
ncbi:MAG: hypothetical protein Q8R06_01940 [Polaromonas sp.]|uniref:hypothetical protein n=1 Tax=Polaromonas sp. TaxID=1869339 RepID=UPI002734AA21|nr:hypothetical protein [Polaromonas sp.]MDP3795897.1 hypothetical protein [Polaromonas sp.]